MQHHSGSCRACSFSLSLLYVQLCVLTISPSSIHKATIHPEENEEMCRKRVVAAGPINKQSRRCDLFTAVCYVEAGAGRRKSF